jgi:DNA-binding NarL/FixJ family response regulator
MNGITHLDGRMAFVNNGRCQYQEAMAAAEQGRKYADDLGLGAWSTVELIEAAVRTGQMERAKTACSQLLEETRQCESDLAEGIRARCRALVSTEDGAEALYREAVERLNRTDVGLELARAQLLYGEWLRRAGRRIDARRELRLAHEAFLHIGIDGFAERARRELVATGETARKRTVETYNELTPQESEISVLAGSGYTNSEIGQKLYISCRTVEWHLRKIFMKLEISSRRQLRDALALMDRT